MSCVFKFGDWLKTAIMLALVLFFTFLSWGFLAASLLSGRLDFWSFSALAGGSFLLGTTAREGCVEVARDFRERRWDRRVNRQNAS